MGQWSAFAAWTLVMLCLVDLSQAGLTPQRLAIMAESAIIDKETGRIFWEGGSTTVSQSIAPKIKLIDVPHLRATILSLVLLYWGTEVLAGKLRGILPLRTNRFEYKYLLSFSRTLLGLPKLPRWVFVSALVLYLIESWTCSTRQYLSNAVENVEEYLESLRQASPTVQWKIRSFHYQNRIRNPFVNATHVPVPSLATQKKVSHTASQVYQYKSCQDQTTAGVWRRQLWNTVPLFTKLILTKSIVLKDAKASNDFLKQQQRFLTTHHGDDYAEFNTQISIDGFQPRVLAVRRRHCMLNLFWIFTLLGLTVPYRRWLNDRSDQVRVYLVKETSADKAGWFSNSKAPELYPNLLNETQRQEWYDKDHNDDEEEEQLLAASLLAEQVDDPQRRSLQGTNTSTTFKSSPGTTTESVSR